MRVDAVVTWVDSTDARWVRAYEEKTGKRFVASSRFTTAEPEAELSVCLLKIRQHMPWVHRIFIVTMDQYPKCIRNETVITHDQIGLDAVFNSLAIETSLHKIPGLSEHFIYFNDDVFLTRDVRISHFFDKLGPRVRVQHKLAESEWLKNVDDTSRLVGVATGSALYHVPHALTKTIMSNAEKIYPEQWRKTRACPLRYQCNEIVPVYCALMIFQSSKFQKPPGEIDDLKFTYWSNAIQRQVHDEHVVCLNNYSGDAQSLLKLLTPTSLSNVVHTRMVYLTVFLGIFCACLLYLTLHVYLSSK